MHAHDDLEQILNRIYMQGRCASLFDSRPKDISKICIKNVSYINEYKKYKFLLQVFPDYHRLKGFQEGNEKDKIRIVKASMPKFAQDIGIEKQEEIDSYFGYLQFISLNHRYDGKREEFVQETIKDMKKNTVVIVIIPYKEVVSKRIFACLTTEGEVFVHSDLVSMPKNFSDRCYK